MRLTQARPIKWLTRFADRMTQHQVGEQAAVIAFAAIYAMFPLVLTLTAIGGAILHEATVRAALIREVGAAFPEQIAKELADVITTAGTYSGLIGLVGFLSLFWAGSNLFAAIEVSFSRIFGVAPRGIVQQRAVAFLIILVFSALLVLSVAASNAVLLRPSRPGWERGPYLGVLGGWVFAMLMHLVIYAVVPNVRLPFRALWPGAVLAGTFLEIATLVFPLYIRHLAGFNRFGDAFGLIFLLMTWFYFLAYILLAGAEVIALRSASSTGRERPGAVPARLATPEAPLRPGD
ncbi:MAG TPA: YihY/virulence factor BrkB family protein [bacterium]|nr:YihY/virulence factor BrkB family protein [bacterium]